MFAIMGHITKIAAIKNSSAIWEYDLELPGNHVLGGSLDMVAAILTLAVKVCIWIPKCSESDQISFIIRFNHQDNTLSIYRSCRLNARSWLHWRFHWCRGTCSSGCGVGTIGGNLPAIKEEVTGIAMSVQMGENGGYEPGLLREAMKSLDWPQWKEAMEEEHITLEAHRTWTLVEPPPGANIVGSQWVYVLKWDATGNIIWYTSHLVAQDFSQMPGIDYFDTYAPVAKMASIRMMLAMGVLMCTTVVQLCNRRVLSVS
jgi:hypothetical protein